MEKSNTNSTDSTEKKKKEHPIFNSEYEILSLLGDGNTAKVYLCRSLKDPKKYVAIKIIREEYISKKKSSVESVEREIQILRGLKHQNIVKILGYGSDGLVKKPSGREIKNLVYIVLEYVSGGLLFDFCRQMGGMGEDAGRYFMKQFIDVLTYFDRKKVSHRDLKLENILIDGNLNIKIADFGFATHKHVHALDSYRGTMTYMAPEIKEGQVYDGIKIDIFSTAVILFIIVLGNFPFKEASKEEYFYKMLYKGKFNSYWKECGGEDLSDEFKDLIIKLFQHDGDLRPTIQEIKDHPWMQVPFDSETIRPVLQKILKEKLENKNVE